VENRPIDQQEKGGEEVKEGEEGRESERGRRRRGLTLLSLARR